MRRITSGWRLEARRVIVEVLDEYGPGVPEKTVRAALREAYPFHQREHYPYKVWLWEVRAALAERYGRPPPPPLHQRPNRRAEVARPDPRQQAFDL